VRCELLSAIHRFRDEIQATFVGHVHDSVSYTLEKPADDMLRDPLSLPYLASCPPKELAD